MRGLVVAPLAVGLAACGEATPAPIAATPTENAAERYTPAASRT